jgi:YHS domain-containing protein
MILSIAAVIGAQEPAKKKAVTNLKCPVMQSDVSEKQRTEYKGQYVYFCCDGCKGVFTEDPEKHIANLSKEDQEAIKPNTTCPMTKEPINKSLSLDHEGKKVYFCCEECVEKFKTDHAAKKSS